MARCSECQNTFEGNRQPLCPFCGAVRPRPRVRVAPPPPEPMPPVQVVVDHSLDKRRKRRQGAEPMPRPNVEVLAETARLLDLEFSFGGAEDLVLPITEFEDLPEPMEHPVAAGDEQSAGIQRLNAALGRFRRVRR